jgi:hypothetical protein
MFSAEASIRRLKRLRQLSRHERRLLIRAFYLLLAARAGLWILPLARVRRRLLHCAAAPEDVLVTQVVWAVGAISFLVPGTNCLTRAVAVEAMLRSAGYESTIEFGVDKESGESFAAHAWVRCGDRIVIGGPTTERYACLTRFER